MGIKFHNLMSIANFLDGYEKALHPEWNTILDSGAYTNHVKGKDVITLDFYIEFLKENKKRFFHSFSLDRIGDRKESEHNFQIIKSHGIDVVPIFQRGDTNVQELIDMLKNNYLVGFGGLANNMHTNAGRNYLKSLMKIQKTVPQSRVHLLGVGLREAYTYAPYSADSSTWTSHLRFAILRLYYKGKFYEFAKHPGARKGKNYIKPSVEKTRVLRQYGLTWEDLYIHKDWSKTTSKISIAATRSWIRQCRALIRKDSRYALACIPVNVQAIHEAWKYERRSWGWTSPTHVIVKNGKV